MVEIPKDIEEAVEQAKAATKAALAAGEQRLLVEIAIPELKAQPIAEKFIPVLADSKGDRLKVYFPDAGAAALARRDWGETPYTIRGMQEVKGKIQPTDEIFLFIEPSSVEIKELEKMCREAGDRPVVMLLPKLENIATIGIGYAARQLRERFINTLQTSYYIQPLEGACIFRSYPSPWQVWREMADGYELISETAEKPVGEALDQILSGSDRTRGETAEAAAEKPDGSAPQQKKPGVMTNLKRLLRALSQ
ncbi:MAG: DUF1995 family protein [Oscillatoria sp. SIO1A7]|nr:DUF1995 family protein [Oscillatoria sp. SIO1A7]